MKSSKVRYLIQIGFILGGLTVAFIAVIVGNIEQRARPSVLLAGVAIGACAALAVNFATGRKQQHEHHNSQENPGSDSDTVSYTHLTLPTSDLV